MRTTAPNLWRFNVDSRRNFFQKLGLSAALFTTPGVFAQELSRRTTTKTAAVEEGPCYPLKLSQDTDTEAGYRHDGLNE